MPIIRQLDDRFINQIAAGEVVERPASVLKELIENALDAKASKIDVHIREGGRTWMEIQDNGSGMDKEDLLLSVQRHTTSKCSNNDLFSIDTFGFRGEALASVASISRLTITTRTLSDTHGWKLSVEGGHPLSTLPAPHSIGTTCEIQDLFYAIPARLKFLKTNPTESKHCWDWVRRFAFAHPHVEWITHDTNRLVSHYHPSSFEERLSHLWGPSIADNIRFFHETIDDITLRGAISLPTCHRSTADEQYFFVNQRFIRDRMLASLLKIAYEDVLTRDRYPFVVLFLDVPPMDIDVNVHPSKTEIRFRDVQKIRKVLLRVLKSTLNQHSQQASTHHAIALLPKHTEVNIPSSPYSTRPPLSYTSSSISHIAHPLSPVKQESISIQEQESQIPIPAFHHPIESSSQRQWRFMGIIQNTYILCESSEEGLILVDMHAAHERIIYESLKKELEAQGVHQQSLATPFMLSCSEEDTDILKHYQTELITLGLSYTIFGPHQIVLRNIPAILGHNVDYHMLMETIIDDLKQHDTPITLRERIFAKLSTYACHHSIRSGHILNESEVQALLMQMSQTEKSGQCNHGRPTYITISKEKLDALFERT